MLLDSSRPRILVFVEFYLPGFKSGGPVRSVANLVDLLGDRFDFWVVTRDHDLTDPTPYPGIQPNCWNQVGKAKVFYLSGGRLGRGMIRRLVTEVAPAVVYLNSYFAPQTRQFLLFRRPLLLATIPVVIAPRGELGLRVLRSKWLKKRLYMTLASLLGMYKDLLWQASAPHEAEEIRALVGADARVIVAPDLPRVADETGSGTQIPKKPGIARMVFLSRIAPKKNLAFALETLRSLRGDVTFDIYGPIDVQAAWQECERIITTLPANIRVTYHGSIDNEQVIAVLRGSHFLVLPTLNENFGHVIFESFVAGRPVVLSDQTPWRGLAAKEVGWDLPVDAAAAWRRTLQECVDMDDARFQAMSAACLDFAHQWPAESEALKMNLELFDEAVRDYGDSIQAG